MQKNLCYTGWCMARFAMFHFLVDIQCFFRFKVFPTNTTKCLLVSMSRFGSSGCGVHLLVMYYTSASQLKIWPPTNHSTERRAQYQKEVHKYLHNSICSKLFTKLDAEPLEPPKPRISLNFNGLVHMIECEEEIVLCEFVAVY